MAGLRRGGYRRIVEPLTPTESTGSIDSKRVSWRGCRPETVVLTSASGDATAEPPEVARFEESDFGVRTANTRTASGTAHQSDVTP